MYSVLNRDIFSPVCLYTPMLMSALTFWGQQKSMTMLRGSPDSILSISVPFLSMK